jgi:long-subunit acyl-CoA synthetase (AMP-forming)
MARFQPFVCEEHILKESSLIDYMPALNPSNPNELFLTYYDLSSEGEIRCKEFTRSDFLELTYRALNVLVSMGLRHMSRQVHFFSGNKVEDLVLRTAAVVLGSVPVTVNWQADTADKILFKVTSTGATVVFVDKNTNASDIEDVRSKAPSVHIVDAAAAIHSAQAISQEQILHLVATNGLPSLSSIRCIIFTSGTTG